MFTVLPVAFTKKNVQNAIKIAKNNGVQIINMSDAEQARLVERVKEKVWPGTSALSTECENGMELYLKWMKDNGRL